MTLFYSYLYCYLCKNCNKTTLAKDANVKLANARWFYLTVCCHQKHIKYYCAKCIYFYNEQIETKAITPCLNVFILWLDLKLIIFTIINVNMKWNEMIGKVSTLDPGDNEDVFVRFLHRFKMEADQNLVQIKS